MPDQQSQEQNQRPLEYQPSDNSRLTRRILLTITWLIASAIIIYYLIRTFASQ
jgi:hypothetical protein